MLLGRPDTAARSTLESCSQDPTGEGRAHSSSERSRLTGVMRSVALIGLLACAALGCGNTDSDPTPQEAVERTSQTSGRFEFKITEDPGKDSIAVDCSGEGDYAAKRIRVKCTLGVARWMEMIAIGRDEYLRASGAPLVSNKWAKSENVDDGALMELSPENVLSVLTAASISTERVREEDVRDAPTVRYRLTADCKLAELTCKGTTPVDVWVGEDGSRATDLPRRWHRQRDVRALRLRRRHHHRGTERRRGLRLAGRDRADRT